MKIRKISPARIFTFIIFAIYAFTMVYALFWVVMASLKSHEEFIDFPNALPTSWLFSNYAEAFNLLDVSDNNMFSMLFNSVWYVVGASFISTAVCCMAAYVLARFDFKGKKIILFIEFTVMLLPIYGSQATLYKLVRQLNIYNSPLFLIKSASATGQIFFILLTFFMTLPKAYEESAFLDGAGYLSVFVKIMLPMAMPSVMAMFIICFISGWNDYMTPLIYLPDFPTMASGLYVYEQISKFNMNKPVYFAGIVLCVIPPMVVFTIFRNKLMTNVTMGGLKG